MKQIMEIAKRLRTEKRHSEALDYILKQEKELRLNYPWLSAEIEAFRQIVAVEYVVEDKLFKAKQSLDEKKPDCAGEMFKEIYDYIRANFDLFGIDAQILTKYVGLIKKRPLRVPRSAAWTIERSHELSAHYGVWIDREFKDKPMICEIFKILIYVQLIKDFFVKRDSDASDTSLSCG